MILKYIHLLIAHQFCHSWITKLHISIHPFFGQSICKCIHASISSCIHPCILRTFCGHHQFSLLKLQVESVQMKCTWISSHSEFPGLRSWCCDICCAFPVAVNHCVPLSGSLQAHGALRHVQLPQSATPAPLPWRTANWPRSCLASTLRVHLPEWPGVRAILHGTVTHMAT